ncbi:MAG: hypothetical protein WC596_03765 [Candidatus Shapirobacteria bacterium]
MDIEANSQNGRVTIFPEKPPTTQLAEKKGLDKNLVAGLVKKSNRILVSISTHKFPFDFFPDTLDVEEGRVTIITRNFFFSSQIHSVDIKDISNIFINMAPFFAQLVVVSKTFTANEIRIKALRKKEAIFARRIVEGLRVFESKQIDTSVYTKEELITKLKELSTTEIVT